MKIYFLVEGKRTEVKVYVAWLSYLLPELARLPFCDEESGNGYYLISAGGYPSIIYDLLPAAIADINRVDGYHYLVVSLDADESSVSERVAEINDMLSQKAIHPRGAGLTVIVQNRCIETWFLGNRRVVARNPQSQALQSYLNYYDVRLNDPEAMGCHGDFNTHSQFHLQYLKEVFREKNLSYTKTRPGHVLERAFLNELQGRVRGSPTDLASLQVFLDFCNRVKNDMDNGL